MKKILAFLMVAVLLCTMLVSCDEDAQALLESADSALLENPYKLTVKMNMECDDEEINEYLSMMNIEIPMTVDGNNLAMDMDMSVMEQTISADVVVYDGVMYYDMAVAGQTVKMKCNMTEEEYKKFIDQSNVSMPVDPANFAELTIEEKDGKKYIACGAITDAGLAELNDMMKESLSSVSEEISFKDISYGITLNDGKYDSVDMSTTYTMKIEGQTYTVSVKMVMTFSYENVAKITAPQNTDDYQSVSYGDLMG